MLISEGTLDEGVKQRLVAKVGTMAALLDDPDLNDLRLPRRVRSSSHIAGQVSASLAPHAAQNLRPSRFSWPQAGRWRP
jgi:hypothetical protein